MYKITKYDFDFSCDLFSYMVADDPEYSWPDFCRVAELEPAKVILSSREVAEFCNFVCQNTTGDNWLAGPVYLALK